MRNKVKNSKKRKTEAIISRVKDNINDVQEYDKECIEIEKFVVASLNVGESITQIRKDLKEMGFHDNRVNLVLRKIR